MSYTPPAINVRLGVKPGPMAAPPGRSAPGGKADEIGGKAVILQETGYGVASHQLDIFVLEPGTDRYLGRMCQIKACPAAKAECLVGGCGATSFLQQHQGFVLQPDALSPARTVKLFDRTTGESRRAVDLPDPPEDEIH